MSAIVLEGVWKAFPRWDAGSRTLRGFVSRRLPLILRQGQQRWALRDVSLTVEPAGSLGIIGQNGAGKSTCLRLASGLSRPTRGGITVPEHTASVLGLGDVFDPSLTGEENALTAAIAAGMRARAARACVPNALEFAELEDFASAPLRTYSDGMKLRLAFGVIAQMRPDALLLDEVLAVGDLRFQARCLERIRAMREEGTVLILASHDLDQVVAECEHALWLQAGSVRAYGDAASVVDAYRGAMMSATLDRTPAPSPGTDSLLVLRRNRFGSQEVTIEAVTLTGKGGTPVSEVPSGGSLLVMLELRSAVGPVREPVVAVAIRRTSDGVVCCDSSTETDGLSLGTLESHGVVSIAYERLDLLPGDYDVEVGVYATGWEYAYDVHTDAHALRVVGLREAKGVFRAPHTWTFSAGP